MTIERALIGTADGSASDVDPYFANVSLLLHGDGTNGAQNNTFIDSSSNNFTITRNGNTTQGSLSPYGTAWSNYFDGSGDYLTVPNNAALTFNTGDFTIEAWIYGSAAFNYSAIVGTGNYTNTSYNMYEFRITNTGTLNFGYGCLSNWNNLIGTTVLSTNTWHHVAVTRSGTTLRLFVNGILDATGSSSMDFNSIYATNVGANDQGTYGIVDYFNGYISNLRLVKGTAVYTSNFTPSTTPLTAISGTSLLTCQSNSFIDNSSNNFTLTPYGNVAVQSFSPYLPTAAYNPAVNGGSGYFDGTGDYLSTSNVCSLSANFTIECWVYYTAAPNNNTFISSIDSGGYGNWNFYYNSSVNVLRIVGTSSASVIQSGTLPITPVAGSWYHFAVSRSGSTVYWWVNGVSAGTSTDSTNWTGSATATRVALDLSGSFAFTGYISNLRVVNGTAIYTTAFSPPTAPLTSVANTWLLLGMTNAGIYDNAAKNDLETVGNAQISTSVKKYGTGSLSFDGTGDYLRATDSTGLRFGTGDYTVEFFLYQTSVSGTQVLIEIGRPNLEDTPGVQIDTISNVIYVYGGAITATNIITAASTQTANTWYHIALTRASGSTKLFINGIQSGSTATDNTNYNQAYTWIGANAGGGSAFVNGYIDDLRITKGVARYTANFTPPTQAFPNQ